MNMKNIRVFQRPETVSIYAEVYDTEDNLATPSNGVVVEIYNPNGIAITGSPFVMTPTETGKYAYYWNSKTDSLAGWYKTIFTAQDGSGSGAKYTIQIGGFQLQ